jgi:hypothetical protein
MTATLETARLETDRLKALSALRAMLGSAQDPRTVFADVSAIAARVLPHDEARLVLQVPGLDEVNVFVRPGAESLVAGLSRPDPSPAEDAGVFPVSLRSGGVGSGVRATVRLDSTTAGAFMLLSNTPRQYTECDVLFVQLAADQIASTVVRQQLTALSHDAALERERAANLEASEQMLRALASVLDIRQVFPQLSEITRRVLPHDRLTMAFLDGQGSCVMEAASNDEGPLAWRARGIDTSRLTDGFFRIVDDLSDYVKPGVTYDPPDHLERIAAAGYRSRKQLYVRLRQYEKVW